MKNVSTRNKKNQQKWLLSQLDDTSTDIDIGNIVNVNVLESESLKQQTKGQPNDWEIIDLSARQNQVIENNIDDQIPGAVSSAVMTVAIRMHDSILTAIHNVVIPRIEMAVKTITGSTGHGVNSEVQNPDRRNFLGNIRNTSVMSASCRLDLDNEINRKDELCNNEDSKAATFRHLDLTVTGELMLITW